MIELPNGGRIVQSLDELPSFVDVGTVYADWETTSRDDAHKSTSPWHHCYPLGLAVTVDDTPGAWYLPVGHQSEGNLPLETVLEWFVDLLSRANEWTNHNVKYDAHVTTEAYGASLPSVKYRCTLNHAKIIDSDRVFKGGYGLDALSKYWLHEDISRFEKALQPYLRKSKDYGRVPIDIMGEYACQDVMTNRRLDRYIHAMYPEGTETVQKLETQITGILIDVERKGLHVNPTELQALEMGLLNKMVQIEEQITNETGLYIRPHVSDDCYALLITKLGLPILGWTDADAPSFDKHVMQKYVAHPLAPTPLIEKMIDYRKTQTLNSLFVTKFQELHRNCVLHSTYNQMVRSGRMSCSDPNAQQLNSLAKALIHPGKGNGFLSIDYSQIEYRVIVHYIQNLKTIQAYRDNPDIDFHQWVADLCGISRKPAKTCNFLMGYGGGKDKLVGELISLPEVVSDIKDRVAHLEADEALKQFSRLAKSRASGIYDAYHANLPELKPTSYRACAAAERNGYVRNSVGRLRRLDGSYYKAFNTVCQGLAADIIKMAMVKLQPICEELGVWIAAQVHDELLFEGPLAVIESPETHSRIVEAMEDIPLLRVPLRVEFGTSAKNWREAAAGKQKISRTPLYLTT